MRKLCLGFPICKKEAVVSRKTPLKYSCAVLKPQQRRMGDADPIRWSVYKMGSSPGIITWSPCVTKALEIQCRRPENQQQYNIA